MGDLRQSGGQIQGTVPSGTADSDNPVKIGGKALSSSPSAVSSGNRVDAWFDILGRMIIQPFTNAPLTARASLTTTSETLLISAPGAGAIYVTSLHGSNAGASLSVISLRDGSTSANDKFNFAMAPNGGGFTVNLNVPWKLTDTTALYVAQSSAIQSYVTVNYYIV